MAKGERTSEDGVIEALAGKAQAGCEASLRQLVERAQGGCEASRNRLAEQYRERIEEYVYRLTLDRDLAEDIAQETIVEMFKVLGKLRRSELFWPWLRRIAFYKTKDVQAEAMRRRRIHARAGQRSKGREDSKGLAKVVSQEMQQLVMGAMGGLKAEHRQVLTMRALEEMDYAEIAQVMGISEFAVRMLFWRAKKSLGRQLGKAGLGKGALLTALVVFGKVTAKSEASAAAVKVSAGSMAIGGTAATVGLLTTTAGMMTTAAVMMVALGSVIIPPILRSETPGQEREKIAAKMISQWQGEAERMREIWYYYPAGVEGPVLVRGVATAGSEEPADCVWVQNGWGNLYYDRSKNRLYQLNCRRWNEDLSLMRLPTDGEFRVPGSGSRVPGGEAGLLVKVVYDEDGQVADVQWERDFNISREEIFQHPWSVELENNVEDLRDDIHQQGWAYIQVRGQLGGKSVSGAGRMPLVAGMERAHWPWLRMEVGGESVGSSFVGLGRPWLGLHTIDVVRRDAAKAGMWFGEPIEIDSQRVEISISHRGHREDQFKIQNSKLKREEEQFKIQNSKLKREEEQFKIQNSKLKTNNESDQSSYPVKLVYRINMEQDWVERIEFYREGGEKEGEMEFEYLKDGAAAPRAGLRAKGDILWLFNLATEVTEDTEENN